MMRRTALTSFGMMSTPSTGFVHPDVQWGFMQRTYRGPGWMHMHKMLPQQCFLSPGGSSYTNHYDRQGPMPDPEDPRHPMTRYQLGEWKGLDGAVTSLIHGDFDAPIKNSARFLQILYDNYLEPFSMNRVAAHLNFFGKVPNWNDEDLKYCCSYLGETATLVGNVCASNATCILEGVSANGALNDVYIGEGTVVMENCSMYADQPTTLHHYQRDEAVNPYQTSEMTEGIIRIGANCVIEPNVMLESCSIAACSRVGHNSKIMKGACIGGLCQILPGSVVLPETNIPDGEVWGGAPARKIGKVSKFEYKRPYYASCMFNEAILHVYADQSKYGDQSVEYAANMDSLETMLLELDEELPDGVKAKIREHIEGKEPFHHMVARVTQGWVPTNRPDHLCGDHLCPTIAMNYHMKHNDDAEGGRYAGTPLRNGNLFALVKNQR